MQRILRATALWVALAGTGVAQQGHPLDGTWYGDWGPSADHRNAVVLVMEYDGDHLTGQINPGPDAVPLDVVALDPTDWTVHIEADVRTFSGNVERYVIDGRLENLGLPNRSLSGAWTHGTTTGDFSVTRN